MILKLKKVINMSILTMGYQSPKTKLSDDAGLGYLTAIIYLAAYNISGYQVCKHASVGCAKSCLFSAGRGRMNSVRQARINRTKLLFEHKDEFYEKLYDELTKFRNKAYKLNLKPAVRLNGTSDLPWENMKPELFTDFSDIMFYDYTKYVDRAIKSVQDKDWPSNYHLTFSRSETNHKDCLKVLRAGGNVAVVFSDKNYPSKWNRFNVYNADQHDLRFLDKRGVQGLYAKGKAKHDNTGFVVNV